MDTDACSVASWTPALGLNLATESAQLPLSPPTVAAPSDSQLAQKAAELAKKFTKFDATAQRASTFLANFPDRPAVTNAAYIFPESTNTNLGNDKEVGCSGELQVICPIRHFSRLPERLCI